MLSSEPNYLPPDDRDQEIFEATVPEDHYLRRVRDVVDFASPAEMLPANPAGCVARVAHRPAVSRFCPMCCDESGDIRRIGRTRPCHLTALPNGVRRILSRSVAFVARAPAVPRFCRIWCDTSFEAQSSVHRHRPDRGVVENQCHSSGAILTYLIIK